MTKVKLKRKTKDKRHDINPTLVYERGDKNMFKK